MKNIKKSVWVILLIFFGVGTAMATEEAKYTIVFKEGDFEVRQYEAHIVAETLVDGDFEGAGGQDFSRLFKYISGNNISRQEIQITSPVTQEASGEDIAMTSPVAQLAVDGRWAVSFMMPSSYALATLPLPKDSLISLREVPAMTVASIEYSGFWSEDGYQSNRDKLQKWINENSFNVVGEPVWARYNAPFIPWFLRRNEVLFPIFNAWK